MTAAEGFMLQIHLNPLRFFFLEDPRSETSDVLRDLAGINRQEFSLDALRERYVAAQEEVQLFAFPNLPAIIEKILEPLRHAKAAYVMGNYLGTIALSGMVAEMTSILTYEVRGFHVNGVAPDEQTQRRIFGGVVEKLGQERRVDVLFGTGLITEDERKNFTVVRELRRKYLHLLSQSHEHLREDALAAFRATANAVASFLGITPGAAGAMRIDQRLLNYLAAKGLLQRAAEPPHGAEEVVQE
jgi:hypothetical protein